MRAPLSMFVKADRGDDAAIALHAKPGTNANLPPVGIATSRPR